MSSPLLLQLLFQVRQGGDQNALVLADPARRDVGDGRRVEVVVLLATAAQGHDQPGTLQHRDVLAHRLTGHVKLRAQLDERLPVVRMQAVEQVPSRGVGESGEHRYVVVHGSHIRQPLGCLSTTAAWLESAQPAATASPRAVRSYRTARPTRRRVTRPAACSAARWSPTVPRARPSCATSWLVVAGTPSARRTAARYVPMRRSSAS